LAGGKVNYSCSPLGVSSITSVDHAQGLPGKDLGRRAYEPRRERIYSVRDAGENWPPTKLRIRPNRNEKKA